MASDVLGNWLKQNLVVIVAGAVAIGAAQLQISTSARATGELEGRVRSLESSLAVEKTRIDSVEEDRKELARALEDVRIALGKIQLDVGQLCAATLGPDRCWTSGGSTNPRRR